MDKYIIKKFVLSLKAYHYFDLMMSSGLRIWFVLIINVRFKRAHTRDVDQNVINDDVFWHYFLLISIY